MLLLVSKMKKKGGLDFIWPNKEKGRSFGFLYVRAPISSNAYIYLVMRGLLKTRNRSCFLLIFG